MRYLLLLLVWSLLTVRTDASVPVYKILQIDPGNDELRINTIFQDRDGFIWIGTSPGLFRYDGYQFDRAIFDSAGTSPEITCIAQDFGGNLYAGFADGSIFVREDGWRRIKSPVQSPVRSIVFHQGRMWLASYGEGIYYRENDKWIALKTPDNSIYALIYHASGKLLAGTDLGLLVIDANPPHQIRQFDQKDGLPDNIIKVIRKGFGNSVWLGTEEKGICEFDLSKKKFIVPEAFIDWNYGSVNSMALLPNEFWIATDRSGIIDFEFAGDRRIREFNRKTGWPFSTISAVLQDNQGNIWIAADNKLLLSPGEKTEFVLGGSGYSFKDVTAVASDGPGNVWMAAGNRLFRYSDLTAEAFHYLRDQEYKNLHITSLASDRHTIWIGTFDNGLFLLDTITGKTRKFDESEGLINASVISIAVNGDSVWLATLGGIALGIRDASGNYRFNDFGQEGAGRGFIYCVHVDRAGRVWFGTDGKGLIVYEHGIFREIPLPAFDKTRIIYSVVSDRYNNIWFSTQKDGVMRYDGRKFNVFDIRNGIREKEISALSTDNTGNVMVIHGKGIDLIHPQNLSVHPIGADAGIGSIEPNLNAVVRDRSGNVWIGTAGGLLRFYNYDRPGGYEPIIRIRKIYTYLNPGTGLRDSVFEYNQNQVSIEYIGLWFGNPESVKYQYRLKGYNDRWINTRDRVITFPNLSPGKYVFEVKATRNNDFRNAPVATYKFTIQKPFWQEWWFAGSIALLLIAGIFLFVRARSRRFRRMAQLEKERISYQYETLRSQINPHFLFNSFNTLISIIEDDREKAVEFAEKLSDYFRHMVQYRDKEVISLAREMELVQTYYYLQRQRFGENLTIETEIPEDLLNNYGVPPLSLQLLIENAAKHNAVSHETPLHIVVKAIGNSRLLVSNNLNPKSNPDRSTGIGLVNIIHRLKIVTNEEVEIRHTTTHFEVELPLVKIANYESIDR
jgi:ligand-binding sensor domain-containing protein